jgi:hypothetical protein
VNCLDCHDTLVLVVPAVAVCTDCGAGVCREHAAVRPRRAIRIGTMGREEPVDPPARTVRCLACDAAHQATQNTPAAPWRLHHTRTPPTR